MTCQGKQKQGAQPCHSRVLSSTAVMRERVQPPRDGGGGGGCRGAKRGDDGDGESSASGVVLSAKKAKLLTERDTCGV